MKTGAPYPPCTEKLFSIEDVLQWPGAREVPIAWRSTTAPIGLVDQRHHGDRNKGPWYQRRQVEVSRPKLRRTRPLARQTRIKFADTFAANGQRTLLSARWKPGLCLEHETLALVLLR